MGRYSDAAQQAADLTNKQLGEELAALTTRFSTEELDKLLPRKSDRAAFLELMAKVEEETDMDTKLAYLRDNVETAGKVVLKLLKYFV